MTDTIQISSQLIQAVQESRFLLAFAAQHGLELEDRMLTILVKAQYRVDHNEWTSEDEADFWQAFSTLNTIIQPVTLESVKATSSIDIKSSRFRFLKLFNKINRTALTYIVLTVVFIGVLLFTQIYWLIGTKLSQNLKELGREFQQFYLVEEAKEKYPEDYQAIRMQIETTRSTLLVWSKIWNREPLILENEEDYRLSSEEDYAAEIAAIQEDLRKTVERLHYFKDFNFHQTGMELVNLYQKNVDELTARLIVKKAEYEKDINDYIFTKIELKTRSVLQILQKYILPLLYGLVGAMAYVLRSLINDIQRETFTSKSGIRYGVRIFLGALAALMIGFFITPNDSGSLSSLPPMAISFLAGYNVEVLFSVMDRFIGKILNRKRASMPQTASETQPKES